MGPAGNRPAGSFFPVMRGQRPRTHFLPRASKKSSGGGADHVRPASPAGRGRLIDKTGPFLNTVSAMHPSFPRQTRRIALGALDLGGGAPVRVQSMLNTDTRDVDASLAQLDELAGAGCEIFRLAVPDEAAAEALGRIRQARPGRPLVADIHFDHRLALRCLELGADGVRINPGNVGGAANTLKVAESTARRGACLRVGVNAGSLEKRLLEKHGGPTAMALAESALESAAMLEREGFLNFKVSIKSSGVEETLAANRAFAAASDAPLHLGVTEAGPLIPGLVKSALGIGFLLAEGVGATIRVSLTRPPVEEVVAGWEILRALGLRRRGVEIISCPTCGRTEVDIFGLVDQVARALRHVERPIKVAVMGCVVNGPGEAAGADVGVAGGRGGGLIFSRGERRRKVAHAEIIPALLEEVGRILAEPS